jgi:predicted DNA-binding helix-hairpin-helix protein
MDSIERLKLLTSQMHLEPAEDTHCPQLSSRKQDAVFTHNAVMPNGKRITLLKTLLSSVCERNCNYCPFRSGRDTRRATFTPEELAQTFMALNHAGAAEGIFLSSGMINGGIHTQDQLIDTAEILRYKLGFKGYLHLKIMPGAEYAQIERAMELADRVSINLEAPNTERLRKLAPHKEFIEELLRPLRWVEEIRHTQPSYKGWGNHWPSLVTQFVVGAVGDTDLELLSTSSYLYNKLKLKRAYYSPFNPIQDTPLENMPPTPALRESRLYEASFLLRDYSFELEELSFDSLGNLPLHTDPKLLWAKNNILEKPIDINRADQRELLRVPGIGLKSANIILAMRHKNTFHNLESLHSLGINTKRAAPFILIDGKRPAYQPELW